MPLNDDSHTFLGLSKSTFFYIVVVYVILFTSWSVIHSGQQDRRLQAAVQQGVQAHTANCALKNDLEDRISSETKALAASKEAFTKNPNLLPGVPHKLIQQGWDAQQAVIDGQTRTAILLDKALSCGSD